MEMLERTISSQLRRWLGVPKCLSSTALYGKNNILQLPFRSLIEEDKVLRIRKRLQYRESRDPKVAAAGIQTRSGRKWSVEEELQVAEERIRHKTLGTIARGRAGLVYFPSPQISRAKGKERHQIVQDEVQAGIEETRHCKMVGLSQQGAWTRWEGVERKVRWLDCWWADFSEVKFLIKSVYDVLPSPSNLYMELGCNPQLSATWKMDHTAAHP